VTFTATNGVSPDATQTFTLTVDEAPAITSANGATFTVGTAGTFDLAATGFPAPTFNIAGALPNGLTFSPTGVLSGTPLAGTGGPYTVTFTPINSVGVGNGQIFTITVDESPTITSDATTVFTVGTAGSFPVTASGYPAPTFSEAGALPAGVSLNPTTGVLSGTPQTGTGGSFPVTITATNGVSPVATETFTLLVNQVPQITSANSTDFIVGTNGSFQLTATGFPAATFAVSETLPPGLSFNSAGLLTGTPLANTGGTYTLHFQATNSAGASLFQTFTLIILQDPAITSPNAATFTVEEFGSFNVTSTGYPAPTYEESGALPDGVTFNDTTGVFSGTPDPGSDGTYTVTITAMNGVDTNAMQTFTITVNP
jgi:hypothetical protein